MTTATSEKAHILRSASPLVVAAYGKVRLTPREKTRLVSVAFCEVVPFSGFFKFLETFAQLENLIPEACIGPGAQPAIPDASSGMRGAMKRVCFLAGNFRPMGGNSYFSGYPVPAAERPQ
jgi:hypothetical protein